MMDKQLCLERNKCSRTVQPEKRYSDNREKGMTRPRPKNERGETIRKPSCWTSPGNKSERTILPSNLSIKNHNVRQSLFKSLFTGCRCCFSSCRLTHYRKRCSEWRQRQKSTRRGATGSHRKPWTSCAGWGTAALENLSFYR